MVAPAFTVDRAGSGGIFAMTVVPKAIRKAIQLIDAHYNKALTLDSVAGHAGISRYHFSRIFKSCTGCPFKNYLNRRRIEAAKLLIRNEGFNASEAAFRVGFGDLSHFSRWFKRLEGVPPSTFRKDLAKEGRFDAPQEKPNKAQ
jgi:AraC-like DNA-binding protein